MRIVFMGTPEFAVSILRALNESEHQVLAVVTAPDKPAGRGRKLKASAVKQYAEEHKLKLLQPTKLKSEDFLQELSGLKADLFVVVAFRMLPEVVWSMPTSGTINLHASLLPNYRGAAPINWAIVNGENVSGLTTFFINENIDTGDILMQERMDIGPDENAGELHDRMMELGADLVLNSVEKIASGHFELIQQDRIAADAIKSAPKIFKEDLKIDWSKSPQSIHDHIRGMAPFPGAWTEIEVGGHKSTAKILKSRLINEACEYESNQLYKEAKRLFVAMDQSKLEILELQLEGKKRLKALDFLNGQEIGENDRVS